LTLSISNFKKMLVAGNGSTQRYILLREISVLRTKLHHAHSARCAILQQMKAKTYALVIEKHVDGYLASFPELPGCHTWAKSYEDAIRYAEEALIGYIEAANRDRTRPSATGVPAKVSLGVVVEVATHV
jgi:predicted RNase H-like HicB family nuclease